jgi:anti-anti-sigma regulatory factor
MTIEPLPDVGRGDLMADLSQVPFRTAEPSRAPGGPARHSNGDLIVHPHLTDAAAVLRLDGVLTSAAAPLVRVAIQEQFATHTRPVVCDLSSLRTIEPAAIGVFHAAAADCGGWPIVALALARPRPAVATQLRKSGAGKFLVVSSSVATAADVALDGARLLRDSVELSARSAAVDGRRFAADCCLRWRVPELLGPTAACALELLRLAVTVTERPFSLQVTYDRTNMMLRARLHTTRADALLLCDAIELGRVVRSRVASDGALILSASVAPATDAG